MYNNNNNSKKIIVKRKEKGKKMENGRNTKIKLLVEKLNRN